MNRPDPDLAQDEGGRIYGTGINLVNDSLFSSSDGARSFDRGTPNCHSGDRPWLASPADGHPVRVEISVDDSLRWLARYERPEVRLVLDPLDKTTITPGAPLSWHLKLETDALAPLYLGKPRDLSQFFSLVINETTVLPLDVAGVSLKTGSPASNGLVRLDVSHSCILECAVDPALFREKGSATVRAVYNSGAQAPDGAWVGTVRSAAVRVEVK